MRERESPLVTSQSAADEADCFASRDFPSDAEQ
jgi:hypothetical protein